MQVYAFDESGWAVGNVEALGPTEAFSLFAAAPEGRLPEALGHHATRFFGVAVETSPAKRYEGGWPLADAALVVVRRAGREMGRVSVVTVPLERAPLVRAAAESGIRRMGGAGFDALLARARRLWQVAHLPAAGEATVPLLVAAALASALLAPVLPPEGGVLFGVRGARDRLARLGWRD